MRYSLLIKLNIITFFCIDSASAYIDFEKKWEFPVKDGVLGIGLRHIFYSGRDYFTLQYIYNSTQHVTLEEDVNALTSVLKDMERSGNDPRKIEGIEMEIREPEMQKRLAVAAAKSGKWNSKLTPEQMHKVVVDLLNSSQAYRELSDLFRPDNLKLVVYEGYYISAEDQSILGLPGHGEVPYSASVSLRTEVLPAPPVLTEPSPASAPSSAPSPIVGAGETYENSLGMRFVPAGTPGVLFSVFDTRVQDFKVFVDETGFDCTKGCYTLVYTDKNEATWAWKQVGGSWKDPLFPEDYHGNKFKQTGDYPVVDVNWNDAEAFCKWLTAKERKEGKIGLDRYYRLPTDEEWTVAVGSSRYPWGTIIPQAGAMETIVGRPKEVGRWM